MKAIILAAGRGSRLGNLTSHKPKCLVELKGKPLLSYQIEALQFAGIKDIAIVAGYANDMIKDARLKVKFINARWQETNMVRSLLSANSYLSADDCIISYSDIFYDQSAVQLLIDAPGDIAIAYDPHFLNLWSQRFENPLADLETFTIDHNQCLLSIGERAKDLAEIKGQYMGLLKITPQGFSTIQKLLGFMTDPQIDKLDMTTLLKQLIASQTTIQGVKYNNTWGEVDQASDLALYETWPLQELTT